MKYHRFIVRISTICLLLSIQSCSIFSPVSRYDPETYLNLLELKIYTHFLYESFIEEQIDTAKIQAIRVGIENEYVYEQSKGESNKETAEQVKLILNMFDRHMKDRMSKPAWTVVDKDNKLENIMEAFDSARDTELKKNKSD